MAQYAANEKEEKTFSLVPVTPSVELRSVALEGLSQDSLLFVKGNLSYKSLTFPYFKLLVCIDKAPSLNTDCTSAW